MPEKKRTELDRLAREFLEHAEIERGRSVKTVENYARYLSRFFGWAKASVPADITEEKVREYRLWLNRQPTGALPRSAKVVGGAPPTLKKRTQNYYLIALRAFLKYLAKRGARSLAPERIELAKVPAREIDLISADELERILRGPDATTEKGLRDRAMLETLFSTGLRVSELCSLPRDLDLSRDEFSVRGKGDKVRVVFLSAAAKLSIKAYLDKRDDFDDAMFAQVPGKAGADVMKKQESLRLTPRSVERIVKFYATKAGVSKKVTPHTIRHCFATDLLGNGADLRAVQALLGHANITTTQVYTHVTDRHLHDVHRAFHGKRRREK
jgi:site-specific recombinase XerD